MKKHKAIVHVPESKNKKIQMIKIWCDLGARLKGNESLSTKIKIHSYCLIVTIKKKKKNHTSTQLGQGPNDKHVLNLKQNMLLNLS